MHVLKVFWSRKTGQEKEARNEAPIKNILDNPV